jgi:hypothetical protein
MLVQAAGAAQKATDFILGRDGADVAGQHRHQRLSNPEGRFSRDVVRTPGYRVAALDFKFAKCSVFGLSI